MNFSAANIQIIVPVVQSAIRTVFIFYLRYSVINAQNLCGSHVKVKDLKTSVDGFLAVSGD